MSKILGHKQQLALAVLKGKRVELVKLQEDYVTRWKNHQKKFGKAIENLEPPRTIYADLIKDYIDRIDGEIKEINERNGNVDIKDNVAGKEFKPCHKTRLGYNCKHRVYENGFKECN